ncbi:MAG: MerR family transcriptional regulator [Hyphomicrobiaceae bacterium]|nr:MAG: MerR family transcriptional regulator [Hyphomicrobiaceae bacterium]
MPKSSEAFRTISEVAEELRVEKHVLRFWEARFAQVKPMKRGGGRRFYRPEDVELLRGIQCLLYRDSYTIRGVQKILKERGVDFVKQCWQAPEKPKASASSRKAAAGAKRAKTVQTAARSTPTDPRAVIDSTISQLEEARAILKGERRAEAQLPVRRRARKR